MSESAWSDLRWFVMFNGIADRWLWDFDGGAFVRVIQRMER